MEIACSTSAFPCTNPTASTKAISYDMQEFIKSFSVSFWNILLNCQYRNKHLRENLLTGDSIFSAIILYYKSNYKHSTTVLFWFGFGKKKPNWRKKKRRVGCAAGKQRVNQLPVWHCNGFGQGNKWKFNQSSSCKSGLSWNVICIFCSMSRPQPAAFTYPACPPASRNVWEAAHFCSEF